MSEDQTKTQTTAVGSLPGGVDEIRGSETDRAVTDSMAFGSSRYCKGESVEASSVPISGGARNDLNHGATVQGRTPERIKEVDAKNIAGSHKGDTRSKPGDTAAASLRQAANGQGGPRSSVGQWANQKSATAGGKGGSFSDVHSDGSYPDTSQDAD